MDMFCENCGAQISDTAKFCKFCGARQTPGEGKIVPPVPVADAPARSGKGKKKDLIEYLDALYTAEMGVVYCDQLIGQLNGQKKDFELRHDQAFVKCCFNERLEAPKDLRKEQLAHISTLRGILEDSRRRDKDFGVMCKILAPQIVLSRNKFIAQTKADLQEAENELRTVIPRLQAEEDKRYKKRVAEWETRKAAFDAKEEQRKEVHDQKGLIVCREFDQSIQDVEEKRQAFCQRRDTLYQAELLYEKFRNPVAEGQLRDYLKMGLVEQLEGPQGGYAFYLSELQAQRICGSIEELQASMETRLDEVIDKMSSMVKELRTANQRLTSLRNAVFDCCESINNGFRQNQDSMGKMTAQLQKEIAAQARPIREAVQRSEYNLFLEGMRKELDRYDYGRLKRPSMDIPK